MIEVNSLYFSYDDKPILSGIDLTLHKKELLILSGPSGAGKTTLIRLIAGLEIPNNGTIKIDGKVLNMGNKLVPPHQRAIGMAFQRPALWPHMSVKSHLEFVIKNNAASNKNERILRLLEETELTSFSNRRPDQLSEGQAQRLSIARALAAEPNYLIMDEPFSNLDPKMRDKMVQFVKFETTAIGAGLLLITHDKRDAELLEGSRFWLIDGQLHKNNSSA